MIFLTTGVSDPPTMLIPRPFGSFFNSILFASVLAGDFIGDFPGDLEASPVPGDKVEGPGDFAGLT